MKKVKAICLESTDVTNREDPLSGLKNVIADAVANAELVMFNGRLVKNRLGTVTPNE